MRFIVEAVRYRRRLVFGFWAAGLAALLPLHAWLTPTRTDAALSPGLVISQLYGGGGNSGATLKNDFIELFNTSNSAVDVSGWSVQYASANGSSWQVTNLCAAGTCAISPGHYYLVQEAPGTGGTTDLPPADAIGVVRMSATAAKVAVVNSTIPLSGTCPLGGSVIDFVGYGSASCFEGSGPASSPSNTTAALRINSGCTDTDNNNSDFVRGNLNPRNSSAAAVACGVSPSPSPTPSTTPTPDCGVERWSVKTGTDPDAPAISFVIQPTTISTMRSWVPPAPIPANSRVAPYETTVWTVNATLLEYKFEGDSDYHLVLQDESGNTIIAEIPYPGCVGSGSPFAASIASARMKFNAMFTAGTSFQFANVPVQITGVGMFDFLHGQTGVAPNGIEIHPVLDISFTPQLLVEPEGGANQAAAVNPFLVRDPFDLVNPFDWLNNGADRNTRVIVFVANVQLAPGETPSSVIVNLTDSNNHTYDIAAEDVRSVPNFSFTQVTFRLPDAVSAGACTLRIKAHGQTTNSGTIRLR